MNANNYIVFCQKGEKLMTSCLKQKKSGLYESVVSIGLIACFLALAGCGGGGGASVSPLTNSPTAFTQISGQVLVPLEALAVRTASGQAAKDKDYDKGTISNQPVAKVEVVFVPDNGEKPQKSETDENGNFTITIPKSNSSDKTTGTLEATKGETKLVSRVEEDDADVSGQANRNVTVESTVAVELKKLDSLKDVSIKELEDIVKAGQAPVLTQKVVEAFSDNKPVVITQEELSEDEDEAEEVDVVVRKDCNDGRQWCLLMTRPKLVKNHSLYRSKLVLVKVSRKAQDNIPDGNVGAGLAEVLWPSGVSYDSYELAANSKGRFGDEGIITSVNPRNTDGETVLSFLFREKDPKNPKREKKIEDKGFDQGRVAILFVYLKGNPVREEGNKAARATVVHQKVRGMLSEKRSAQSIPSI